MASLEDYALIGDTHSAALISSTGSIDWLCLPRLDSECCFGALLDQDRGGHWRLAPTDEISSIARRYRHDTLVLETEFTTDGGSVRVIDCMPLAAHVDADDPRAIHAEGAVLRVVVGLGGMVGMAMEFAPRFDYGSATPWVHRVGDAVVATAGADALDLRADLELEIQPPRVTANFEIQEAQTAVFLASYRESQLEPRSEPVVSQWRELVDATITFWRSWSARCRYQGQWRDDIVRSLVTLKAMTYSPTGGIVAAVTTSLPERAGGSRNWDYRYCWLRDATLALEVLLDNGYRAEAEEWHEWLLRATSGDPNELQVMYSVTGERLLPQWDVKWLSGYEGSKPVRVGNDAIEQFQLDVFGEVMDLFHAARRTGIDPERAWLLQRQLADVVAERWREPDNGIWEFRAGRHHFTHSKVMAWVALDRAIKAAERDPDKEASLETWNKERVAIREEVLSRGYNSRRGCFTMSYESEEVDASLLRLPLVGFLPATDDRMRGTIEAIERDLLEDGLVRRYRTGKVDDGLPTGEGAFFLCTFWLVDCLVLLGRSVDARRIFEGAMELRNDVGLLSEQYSLKARRQVGNLPQAFSHFAMITAALAIERGDEAPGLKRWL